jgi:hypothetical protein
MTESTENLKLKVLEHLDKGRMNIVYTELALALIEELHEIKEELRKLTKE